MKEIKGNLWDYHDKGYIVCITTNGFVKKNGEAVMGAGCALEAKTRFPDLPKELGKELAQGNDALYFMRYKLITFPVKHHWRQKADIELIKKSCKEITEFLNHTKVSEIVLVRPGCGNGKLDWETEVKPVIAPLLDDRVLVITNE